MYLPNLTLKKENNCEIEMFKKNRIFQFFKNCVIYNKNSDRDRPTWKIRGRDSGWKFLPPDWTGHSIDGQSPQWKLRKNTNSTLLQKFYLFLFLGFLFCGHSTQKEHGKNMYYPSNSLIRRRNFPHQVISGIRLF